MGFILQSLLQLVGRAFYYYYSVVVEENRSQCQDYISLLPSDGEIKGFHGNLSMQHLRCPVIQSSFSKCLQNQQPLI